MLRTWALLTALILLGGCATGTTPSLIRTPPQGNPSVDQVRANLGKFTGTALRWGGRIVSVENRKADTLVTIVEHKLERGGRPYESLDSKGRFMARVEGFLDPAIYTPDRLITIAGVIEGEATRPVGDFEYRMPVVAVRSYKLWEPLPEYDPYFNDPWYPYQPYPYYNPYWRYPSYPMMPHPHYPWW